MCLKCNQKDATEQEWEEILAEKPKPKTLDDLLAEGKAKFKDLPNWPW